jgi:transcriptional regulator with XRE-family HTH domain
MVKSEVRHIYLPRNYLFERIFNSGLKTSQVIDKLGIDKKQFYMIENGQKGHRQNPIIFYKLSRVLSCDLAELIKDEVRYQIDRVEKGYAHCGSWTLVEFMEIDDNGNRFYNI